MSLWTDNFSTLSKQAEIYEAKKRLDNARWVFEDAKRAWGEAEHAYANLKMELRNELESGADRNA